MHRCDYRGDRYRMAKHDGFTEEELDFIINYDIKYRMGLSGGPGVEEA